MSKLTVAVVASCLAAVSMAGCPTHIEPIVASVMEHTRNGPAFPAEWLISPTAKVTKAPGSNKVTCNPTFMGTYGQHGCVSLGDVEEEPPAPSNDQCTYLFRNLNHEQEILNVTLRCDPTAKALSIDEKVSHSSYGNFFSSYWFTGSHHGVCDNRPTTTPAPTAPPRAICPAKIPLVDVTLTQMFNGNPTDFNFTISPTQLGADPTKWCRQAAYISQRLNTACNAAAHIRSRVPTVVGDACEYSFTDGESRFMDLRVTCDPNAKQLTLNPIVNVRGAPEGFTYSFEGRFEGVCVSHSVALH